MSHFIVASFVRWGMQDGEICSGRERASIWLLHRLNATFSFAIRMVHAGGVPSGDEHG
jgi:hypothetical protein